MRSVVVRRSVRTSARPPATPAPSHPVAHVPVYTESSTSSSATAVAVTDKSQSAAIIHDSVQFMTSTELVVTVRQAMSATDADSIMRRIESVYLRDAEEMNQSDLLRIGRSLCEFFHRQRRLSTTSSDPDWSSRIKRVAASVVDRLDATTMDAQDIANAFFILIRAVLLSPDSTDVVRHLANAAVARIHEMTGPQIGLILRGLRLMGHPVPTHVVLDTALDGKLDRMSAKQLVYLIAAIRGSDEHSHSPLMWDIVGKILVKFDAVTLADCLMIVRTVPVCPSTRDLMELCMAEIQRNMQLLTPRDVTDLLCFLKKTRYHTEIMNTTQLVDRFVWDMWIYTPRQLTLAQWSVSGRPGGVSEKVLSYLEQNPERLISFTNRDSVLLMSSLVADIPHCANPRSFVGRVSAISSNSELNPKTFNFQECSMLLLALGRLRDYSKKLSIDQSSRSVSLISDSIIPRINHLLRHPHRSFKFSNESLLTGAWAFGLLGFKSQQVLVDLYRTLYSRASTLSPNQLAFSYFLFATLSGVRDDQITVDYTSRLIAVLPSVNNANLTNLLIAVRECRDVAFRDAVLDQVSVRRDSLTPDQLLTAATVSSQIDDREGNLIIEKVESNLDIFSLPQLIRLFAIDAPIGELKWQIQVKLSALLKSVGTGHIVGSDALLLAGEIRRLGPRGVKTSLRVRFNKVLVDAIENRRIPTGLLLPNLNLVDDIGTWHCLPIGTQQSLWTKASEAQRRDVREPLDHWDQQPLEVRRRRIDSSRLIVKVGEPVDGGERVESTTTTKDSVKLADEKVEIEEYGESSPISKFIQLLRKA